MVIINYYLRVLIITSDLTNLNTYSSAYIYFIDLFNGINQNERNC